MILDALPTCTVCSGSGLTMLDSACRCLTRPFEATGTWPPAAPPAPDTPPASAPPELVLALDRAVAWTNAYLPHLIRLAECGSYLTYGGPDRIAAARVLAGATALLEDVAGLRAILDDLVRLATELAR